MLTYILFVLGFVLLIKGADFLIDGGSAVAAKFNVPQFIIGLTIISFGTSLPELIVNINASISGSAEIAVGNVFGSNIANVLLILGVAAIINPLPIRKAIYYSEIPFMLIATLLVGFIANASLFSESKALEISRVDGAILLLFFFLFMGYIFAIGKENKANNIKDDLNIKVMTMGRAAGYILMGMAGLYVGGEWIVDGAIVISKSFGLSETFIGLTVIAIGTSLPELVTSAVAAAKKNTDIAVGNVVGSNIFNLLWILGISSVIKPLPFHLASNTDILVVIFSSTLLIFAVAIGKGKQPRVDRIEGVFFVLCYIAYIVYLVNRG